MENNLIVFENAEFGSIRTTVKDGEPWFVAADVCKALSITNNKDAVRSLEDDEKSGVDITDPHGRVQKTNCISEPGLYSLVLRSRKPEAKAFKRWITHDVIPAIRKTGGYVSNDELFISTYLPNVDEATRAMFRSTLETVRSLNAKIEQDKPKVLFAEAVSTAKTSILIGEFAKILRQNGVDIGQNRLFEWMRQNGYLISRKGSDYNMPTQKSMDMKLFEIKETAISHSDGSISVSKTTKISGRGQQFFVNKFLGERQLANDNKS